MSSSEAGRADGALDDRVERLSAELRELIAGGGIDRVSEQSIQRLMAAAVKLYVAKREAGADFLPFEGDDVTATEVSVAAHGMLRAADMQVFELSLWSGFGSR